MQANFDYEPVRDAAGCQLSVTVLADRDHIRAEMREDALAAGFRVRECCSLEEYAQGPLAALGDLVMVDCAVASADALALLSRLDMRGGKAGAQLVVSTTMAALDSVFGCFSLSAPQILVDPGRAERIIAIGRVLARVPNLRLREMGEEDRLMLLRLTEQVGRIAERLEKLSPGQREGGGAFRFESPAQAWRAQGEDQRSAREEEQRPRLPEAAVLRRIIKARQARMRHFDADLFADPAWDILLDLAAARAERQQVSVTSLCIAAGVPATTALRWIGQMVDADLLVRVSDPHDRRRAYIALSDNTADALARYFSEIGVTDLAVV
ncbi:MAG: MarR family transcriptional regulator [Qipengyuania citrea]|jgi:DNA-binding MarR family transcriptional regulator|uniref:MarR family transcriptional regulator n=1 Tax=Qipengyuania TaxID=1855416 RepID=UPI000E8B0297|nr:MarR family transcriptional regulator [Qipengyuania citrea]RZP20039.1 MAG: MarR family transcriptional regulator [Erythrobacter sp.]HAL89861.1 MarR family transcriptional regulator [Erythrobacter sp.]HAN90146.1 MarR family transcriptional regulator [Erythrobacter sp.]HBC16805.1 MarR family transcriptional regulator [Erythrobacter sp.]|tara:strand:- start:2558 stop:3529 length:972 start_codon:yes stop_codon:yes gene_type:complete